MRKLGAYIPADPLEIIGRAYPDAQDSQLYITPPVGWNATDNSMLSTSAGNALTSGRVNFHRLYLGPGTYDALTVYCSTAQSGGTVSLLAGLYPDDGTGSWPATSAGPITSATFPALTTTGTKLATLGSTLVVAKPTLYWVASLYLASVAPTTAPVLTAVSNNVQNLARPSTTNLATAVRGYYRTGLAALPTDATTTANLNVSTSTDVTTVSIRRSS